MSIPLCNRSDIDDPGSRGFEIKLGRKILSLFLVLKDGVFSAFINECPHTGVNLEWQEHRFLDLENMYIQCTTHDALFETGSGLCIAGPCVGKSLKPVKIEIVDDVIHLDPASVAGG